MKVAKITFFQQHSHSGHFSQWQSPKEHNGRPPDQSKPFQVFSFKKGTQTLKSIWKNFPTKNSKKINRTKDLKTHSRTISQVAQMTQTTTNYIAFLRPSSRKLPHPASGSSHSFLGMASSASRARSSHAREAVQFSYSYRL